MFFTAMVHVTEMDIFNLETWGVLFPVIAWFASVFTFIYCMILVFKTFMGKYQPEKLGKKPHEAPIGMLISPIILVSLVIIFGLFPNLLSDSLISPAMAAVLPSLLQVGGVFEVHITFWHGLTIELFMTMGVIIMGLILYKTYPKWKKIYKAIPEKLSINGFYDGTIERSQSVSNKLMNMNMNGSIRSYLAYIFAFLIIILSTTLIWKNAFKLDTSNVSSIGVYEVVLAIFVMVGSISILFVKSRMTSIILLGAVGYTVSLFYVLFRAPDLALTQLVIETISVALFLVCFYHLPKLRKFETRLTFKLTNALISFGVGAVVTAIALSAHSNKLFSSISQYYVENTYEEAAGKNMVNVILVDFRGFDTMFEICVLAIAALGIFSMIKLRLTRRKEG
jgi:multicomponent Na+:H+ antiporter subunit A